MAEHDGCVPARSPEAEGWKLAVSPASTCAHHVRHSTPARCTEGTMAALLCFTAVVHTHTVVVHTEACQIRTVIMNIRCSINGVFIPLAGSPTLAHTEHSSAAQHVHYSSNRSVAHSTVEAHQATYT